VLIHKCNSLFYQTKGRSKLPKFLLTSEGIGGDVKFLGGGKIVGCSGRAGRPASLLTGDHCGRNDHRFHAFDASPLIDGTDETVIVFTVCRCRLFFPDEIIYLLNHVSQFFIGDPCHR